MNLLIGVFLLVALSPCSAIAQDSKLSSETYSDPSTADALPDDVARGLDEIPSVDVELKDIILPNGYNVQEFRDHFEKGTPLRELPRSQPTILPRESSDNADSLMK